MILVNLATSCFAICRGLFNFLRASSFDAEDAFCAGFAAASSSARGLQEPVKDGNMAETKNVKNWCHVLQILIQQDFRRSNPLNIWPEIRGMWIN